MLALQRAKHVDYMVNNSHRKNRVGVGGAGVAGVSTVSTQADIAHTATSYESDDESSSRRKQRATNMYSKQEFREQYCINPKQLDLLELEKSKKDRFLGCLSQYHIESPCSRANRSSFLSVCVRRRVPSDENLNTDYAPIQRYPRFGQPTAAPPELYAYDAELESSYFRRRPRSVCSQPDPKKYTWMPEDEDFTRMEWPPSMMDEGQGWPQHYTMDQISSITRGGSLPRPPSIIPCPAHTPLPPPPPPPAPPHVIPPHRPKHVSFARSHTLTTFDDSAMPATLGGSGRFRRECSERLLDGRTQLQAEQQFGYPVMLQPTFPPHVTYFPPAPVHYPPHIAHAPSPLPHPAPAPQLPQPAPRTHPPQETNQSKPLLDSVKKGVMRTQATQTEVSLGRKAHPTYLSLSPRTIKRVTMVAAGVQTNGFTSGPRRLTKSFSEVGGDRLLDRDQTGIDTCGIITDGFTIDHEKLHRTQSEEPPRSPRSPSALNSPVLQREDSDDITDFSPVKSGASFDKSSDISILQRQAQEYFHQNFQFIHESDRDDTVDDEVVDMETLEKSMALNRKNLEFLQQKIAEQARGERSIKSILSKTTSDASQRTISSNPLSKHSTFQSEPSTETSATTTDDSERNEREIMIDFKPRLDDEAVANSKRASKRLLQKTLSEGEILLDARKSEIQGTSADGIKDAPIIMSTSQENMTKEDKEQEGRYKHYITQNYAQTPIKDEGIFSLEPNGSFSSSDGNAPYEDFHEKYISYKHDAFRKRSVSLEEPNETDLRKYNDSVDDGTAKSSPASPSAEDIRDDNVTSRQGILTTRIGLAPLEPTSPFASSESLTVDPSRDHSDGMWNESQATVLQVDSGTENGTVISSSDLSSLATSPGALALLTPTSRRKQLLILQHQQRSSMDTDALDEEFDASQSQSPTSPRMKLDTPGTAAARTSLSPPAVIQLTQPPITKQPHIIKNGSPVGAPKSNHTPAIAITHPSLDLTDVPMRRTPSVINKKRERALSPSRRKDLQRKAQQKYEPNATIVNKVLESSPDPNGKHTNGDPNLARTDSGKTNTTDVSESTTTTTDDYVTANSDSSKKSGTKVTNQNPENNKAQEGSSFESASSLYSSTRTENMCEDFIVQSFSPPLHINEDLIVPSFSPPQQLAEKLNKCSVELIQVKADIVQPPKQVNKERRDKTDLAKPAVDNIKPKDTNDLLSGKSSSSGSYSLTGSNPNFAEETKKEKTEEKKETKLKTTTPEAKSKRQPIASSPEEREQTVPVMKGSVSDDERSGHYSSSGYYESPVEDDDDDGGLTYKHSQKYRTSARPWTTEEKRRKKKAFTLEFSKSYDDSVSTSQDDFSRKSSKNDEATSPYRPERSASKANGRIYIDDKITRANKMFKAHYTEKCKSVQSSPRDHIDIDKVIKEKDTETKRQTERERHVKRTKLKTKSPVQNKLGENNTPGHSRAQFLESQRRGDGIGPSTKLHLNIPTSDDSSEQYKKDGVNGGGNISPRKYRRLRDSPRRKSNACANSARSPTSVNAHTGHRTRRKSGSNESISLPGSLPRRKPSMPVVTAGLSSLEAEDIAETSRTLASAGSRLTPLRYIRSPIMSPRPHRKHEKDKESKCAKAASAESLRSVSPGSDSVFYSEQADASAVDADGEAKAHCLHCGKEVHIVTASHDHDSRITSASTSHTHESFTDGTPDIVPAPAGFADSPANGGGSSGGGSSTSKRSASGARLYKKLDKRYRSEDKSRHHHRHRQEVRAKSEERGKEEYATTERREPRIARSAGTSLDKIGGSSGSVDPDEVEEVSGSSAEGTVSGKKDESGVYAAPWWCGNWILVPSQDDVWTRLPPADLVSGDSSDRSWSEEATESETEFSKKYLALTHRLVHRRACIHMYKRQAESGFVQDYSHYKDPHESLRKRLEEIFKLMLLLWCRQCQANKAVSAENSESDKTVVVRRGNEEFGFRIHGSKPVVVSAIEPDTPAETSGLEVGDIIIAVNGINVLDKSHSEVVKIAHAGSEILELEVARTCEAVASLAHEGGAAALYSGYLWRAAPSPGRAPHHLRWTRRWFVLKRDNCLYYYKTDSSTHPVGALMLINYQLVEEDVGKVHGFRLQRGGGARLQLAADSAEASARWRAVLAHAIDASSQRDGWLEVSMRNMKLPPSSVPRPDCFGYVYKLDSKWKHWSKRYCVLKDACLYFYSDGNSKSAFGMACLHGYRVQQCSPGGRKFAFEVMPAEPKQRHFYFHTESEMDKKRWMAALEYSIDRWMKAG